MVRIFPHSEWNFTKNDFVLRDFSKTSRRRIIFKTLISILGLVPKQHVWIYWRQLFFKLTYYYCYYCYYYQFILCWQDEKILQLKYLHNRSYTKNDMLIKVNKLKLIWNKVKERKGYNNVKKTNFSLLSPIFLFSLYTCCNSDVDSECLKSSKLIVFAATAT